jgi:cation/acetate symporter
VVLVIFSPVVSGKPPATPGGKSPSLFPAGTDFSWFPLDNPGLVSIPMGFLCGFIGTIMSKEYNKAKYAELEVRSLTGVGMEKASSH